MHCKGRSPERPFLFRPTPRYRALSCLHQLLPNADVGCLNVLRPRCLSPNQVGNLEPQEKGCD